MRDELLTIFLIVVRHQPVIRRAHQIFEEAPGLARDFAEGAPLGRAERLTLVGKRQARDVYAMTGERSHSPIIGSASSRRPGASAATSAPAPKATAIAGHIWRATSPGDGFRARDLIGGDPLEPAAPAHEQPPERPADCLNHQPALMRQEDGRQQ